MTEKVLRKSTFSFLFCIKIRVMLSVVFRLRFLFDLDFGAVSRLFSLWNVTAQSEDYAEQQREGFRERPMEIEFTFFCNFVNFSRGSYYGFQTYIRLPTYRRSAGSYQTTC